MIARALILSFFLIRAVSSSSDKCFTSSCDSSQPQIRFPFRLNRVEPDRCPGYPGFDLSCDESSRFTILRLSNSSYQVNNIDYEKQQIWLSDPNQCLPQLLLTLNLSTTPFRPALPEDLALFNCSSDISVVPAGFDLVSCVGGSDYKIFAAPSPATLPGDAPCALVRNISVPGLRRPFDRRYDRRSVLPGEILLTWDDPWCGGCEVQGGVCFLKPNSDHDLQCLPPPMFTMHVQRLTIFALGFLVVIGLFIVGNACRHSRGRNDAGFVSMWVAFSPPAPAAAPHVPTGMSGLDQQTINSFPTIELGESVRISRTENNVCAICLGEYKPKDVLRTIPACNHFFHSNCIDEWLHRNPTCPICRESQKVLPEP